MKLIRPHYLYGVLVLVFIGLLNILPSWPISSAATTVATCNSTESFCLFPRVSSSLDPLLNATMPKVATPAWLQQSTETAGREVAYVIETRGAIVSDVEEFKRVVAATLNDSRGWARLGVRFVQVESGGEMKVVLSEASQMTTFSETGCDVFVSCTVGEYVIFNQDRWLNGSTAWNATGASLDDYRRMVINHETGHWLGHGHVFCQNEGDVAGVMQQQTISMQGCKPNPWPLPSEMYSPKLGING